MSNPLRVSYGTQRRQSFISTIQNFHFTPKTANPFLSHSTAAALFRWPMALLLYWLLCVECFWYFSLRAAIVLVERCLSMVTHKGRLRRRAAHLLQQAPSYAAWRSVAQALDEAEENDKRYYKKLEKQFDLKHVESLVTLLQQAMNRADTKAAAAALDQSFACLANNGILESQELFSFTHTGEPVKIVGDLGFKIVDTLDWLTSHTVSNDFLGGEKRATAKLLKRFRALYGQTALCCSGGTNMGAKHIGTALALLDQNCLPSIMSGSSAGAIFSGFLACRTDEEIQRDAATNILVPKITCLSQTWLERIVSLVKHGYMLNPEEWNKSISWFTHGTTTFLEAHQRTGRVFNVAVTSMTEKARPVLLNYLTAPDVTLASAILASCSCPGLLPPRPLQVKNMDGSLEFLTSNEALPGTSTLYFDGSVKQDIPKAALTQYFNSQFFAVGQTNPHVVPFLFESKLFGQWRPLSIGESFLKSIMLQQIQFLSQLELAPWQLSSLLLQDYTGCVTIVPELTLHDLAKLCDEPSIPFYNRLFHVGKAATHRFCPQIKLRMRISDTLEKCLAKLGSTSNRESTYRSRSQSIMASLRRSSITYDCLVDAAMNASLNSGMDVSTA